MSSSVPFLAPLWSFPARAVLACAASSLPLSDVDDLLESNGSPNTINFKNDDDVENTGIEGTSQMNIDENEKKENPFVELGAGRLFVGNEYAATARSALVALDIALLINVQGVRGGVAHFANEGHVISSLGDGVAAPWESLLCTWIDLLGTLPALDPSSTEDALAPVLRESNALLTDLFTRIDTALRSGRSVFLYDKSGSWRVASFFTAYLMWAKSCSLKAALSMVTSLLNPIFGDVTPWNALATKSAPLLIAALVNWEGGCLTRHSSLRLLKFPYTTSDGLATSDEVSSMTAYIKTKLNLAMAALTDKGTVEPLLQSDAPELVSWHPSWPWLVVLRHTVYLWALSQHTSALSTPSTSLLHLAASTLQRVALLDSLLTKTAFLPLDSIHHSAATYALSCAHSTLLSHSQYGARLCRALSLYLAHSMLEARLPRIIGALRLISMAPSHISGVISDQIHCALILVHVYAKSLTSESETEWGLLEGALTRVSLPTVNGMIRALKSAFDANYAMAQSLRSDMDGICMRIDVFERTFWPKRSSGNKAAGDEDDMGAFCHLPAPLLASWRAGTLWKGDLRVTLLAASLLLELDQHGPLSIETLSKLTAIRSPEALLSPLLKIRLLNKKATHPEANANSEDFYEINDKFRSKSRSIQLVSDWTRIFEDFETL